MYRICVLPGEVGGWGRLSSHYDTSFHSGQKKKLPARQGDVRHGPCDADDVFSVREVVRRLGVSPGVLPFFMA